MSYSDGITCPCFGWCVTYAPQPGERHHRDCKHWSREHKGAEVHTTKRELIVLGDPDEGDESHNCDAMGCGTFSHVLFRFPLTPGVQEDARACTCHPDDNPPKPCPRKFALSECRAAAGVAIPPEGWRAARLREIRNYIKQADIGSIKDEWLTAIDSTLGVQASDGGQQ